MNGISLPSADDIGTKHFVSEHNDIGLGEKEKPLLIRKVWSGKNSGLPDTVQVTLFKESEELGNYTLHTSDAVSGTSSWQIRTEAMPVYDDEGNRITYSIRETAVSGAEKDDSDRFYVYGNGEEEAGTWTASYETEDEVLTVTNTWEVSETELTGDFSFTVEKCDQNGTRISLAGKTASFELDEKDENDNWTVRETKQTQNGLAVFEGLSEGVYLLKETSAPQGYVRNEEGILITVESNGTAYVRDEIRGNGIVRIFRRLLRLVTAAQPNWEWHEDTAVLKVKNEQIKGKITIHKEVQDDAENTLETDAVYRFALVPQGETAPREILNVHAGETAVSSNLPYGTYTIRELLPSEDPLSPVYVFDHAVLSASAVQISENNEVKIVEALNVYRRDTVSLPVEKRWDGTVKEAAEFELYSDQKTTAVSTMRLTAAQDWKGIFPDLPKYTDAGEEIVYTIREVPQDGYAVTKHKEGNAEVFTNHRIDLLVRKTDENGNPLSGAVLVLEDKKGSVIHEWTSGEQAEDLSEFLHASSSWQVRETAAPEGYALSSKAYVFFTDEEGNVTGEEVQDGVLTVTDTRIRLSIKKLDEDTGRAVTGAELYLENSEGQQVQSWTTDGSPKVFTGLKKGTYTLRERKAPEGYKKAAAVTFTLTDTDEEQEVIMYDKRDNSGPELPDTGDHSNLLFWMNLGGISLITASVTGFLLMKIKPDAGN